MNSQAEYVNSKQISFTKHPESTPVTASIAVEEGVLKNFSLSHDVEARKDRALPVPKFERLWIFLSCSAVICSSSIQALYLDADAKSQNRARFSILISVGMTIASLVRVGFFSAFANFTPLSFFTGNTWVKLFLIRFLGTLSCVLGTLSVITIGGDIMSVARQLRIPLIVAVRYIVFEDVPNLRMTMHLFLLFVAAIGFVLAASKFEDSFGVGIGLIGISIVCRSAYYGLSEYFLKSGGLHELDFKTQQLCFSLADSVGYLLMVPAEIAIQKRGFSWESVSDGMALGMFWGLVLLFFLSDIVEMYVVLSCDSTVIIILFALVMCCVWAVKCIAVDPSAFYPVRITILIFLVVEVLMYLYETREENARHQMLPSKMEQNQLQAVPNKVEGNRSHLHIEILDELKMRVKTSKQSMSEYQISMAPNHLPIQKI